MATLPFSGGEFVAEAGHCEDEFRLFRVAFDLVAKAGDVNVHRAGERFRAAYPQTSVRIRSRGKRRLPRCSTK